MLTVLRLYDVVNQDNLNENRTFTYARRTPATVVPILGRRTVHGGRNRARWLMDRALCTAIAERVFTEVF
eukprot:6178339-Pleurochrysis_carterae.AAC.2